MDKEQIQLKKELEKIVLKYYEKDDFKIKSIVNKKIEVEVASKDAIFTRFCKILQDNVRPLTVYNFMHFNFPNYVAAINFPDNTTEDIAKRSYLVICLSLLADYYTLYFSDTFYFRNYGDYKDGVDLVPPHFTIHSLETNPSFLDSKINAIKESIAVFFPNRKYIRHDLLKKWKNEKFYPYGEDEKMLGLKQFSLFELLFDRQLTFCSENMEVLK
ncbi:MAG: hypothetical protein QM594_00955 [Niabella sp.]